MSDDEKDLFGDEENGGTAVASPAGSPAASPAGTPAEDGADLFGDDSPPPEDSRSKRSESTPRSSPNPLEYAESEGDMEETSEIWANVPVPQWPRLQPTDGKVWHLKLPGYVNLEPRPYDSAYYSATLDDAEDPTSAKGKMIGVRNTMRWRWVGTGDDATRQSNARMLRWSDGSVSLQLGNEMFDVAPSYGASLKPGEEEKRSVETTFVCVAAPNEQVLVTESAVAGQLSLVPTSMDSKTHRELVKHVGQQHVKHSRMKIIDDEADPDKVAELLARAAPQRQVAPRSRPTQRRTQGSGLGRSKRAIRRADSEESELGSPVARRGAGDYDEDDGFVVADSDEEYAKASKERRKAKKSKRRYSDSMDEAEMADARIEAMAREKKRAKKDKGKARALYSDDDEDDAEGEPDEDEAEMDMDVESEEE